MKNENRRSALSRLDKVRDKVRDKVGDKVGDKVRDKGSNT